MSRNEAASSPVPAQPSQPEIAGIALSMRIPAFWRERARLWFCQLEAATSDLHKSQTQLAHMVIAQLERRDIEQIADLLYNPPADDQYYAAIKNRLISVYEESDDRQLQKLLSQVELGDQKPSQLLRRMRDLARDKVPDTTLRLMWTNHLPSHIRSLLAVIESFSTKTTLDELALLADKMLETTSCNSANISSIEPTSSRNADTHYLVEEIKKLSIEIAALKNQRRNPRTNNHHNRNNYNNKLRTKYLLRNRSPSTSRNNNNNAPARASNPLCTPQEPPASLYCYYHRTFGTNAKKCMLPCSYNNNTQHSISNSEKLNMTLDAAESSVSEQSYRLFITDQNTKLTFLVDTGANVSVLPPTFKEQRKKPLNFELYAANNTIIPMYCEKTLELDLNLRRPFRWNFVIAKVSIPILGADFLRFHGILVDLKQQKLIDSKTKFSTQSFVQATTIPTIRNINKLKFTQKTRTTPYHPQSNGRIERWHRSRMSLRAAPHSDTGVSFAQITYGNNLRLPCDFFTTSTTGNDMDFDYDSRLRDTISSITSSQNASIHGSKKPIFVHKDLQTCEQVFIRTDAIKKPLQPTYEGPYKVIERDSKCFKLLLPDRRSAVISIDRLKPAYTINEDTTEDEPTSAEQKQDKSISTNSIPPAINQHAHTASSTTSSQAPSSLLKTTRLGRRIQLPVRFR